MTEAAATDTTLNHYCAIHMDAGWVGVVTVDENVVYAEKYRKTSKRALRDAKKLNRFLIAEQAEATIKKQQATIEWWEHLGSYLNVSGIEKAVSEKEQAERDARITQHKLDMMTAQWEEAVRERDAFAAHEMQTHEALGAILGAHTSLADAARCVVRERDEARAEVERLRAGHA